MGRGYCRNWVIDPQGKSSNLGKIRSMHFRLLLLLLTVGLFPGGPKHAPKHAPNLSAPHPLPLLWSPLTASL